MNTKNNEAQIQDKTAEEKEDERFWNDLEAYEETSSNDDESTLVEDDQSQHSLTSTAESTPKTPAESEPLLKQTNKEAESDSGTEDESYKEDPFYYDKDFDREELKRGGGYATQNSALQRLFRPNKHRSHNAG